jgi:hypothetical protein
MEGKMPLILKIEFFFIVKGNTSVLSNNTVGLFYYKEEKQTFQ